MRRSVRLWLRSPPLTIGRIFKSTVGFPCFPLFFGAKIDKLWKRAYNMETSCEKERTSWKSLGQEIIRLSKNSFPPILRVVSCNPLDGRM